MFDCFYCNGKMFKVSNKSSCCSLCGKIHTDYFQYYPLTNNNQDNIKGEKEDDGSKE